jgi:hypothetical protein
MKWIMAMGAVLAIPALAFGAASYTLTAGGSGMDGATTITVCKLTDPCFSIDLGISQSDVNGVAGFDGALEASSNDVFYASARSWVVLEVDENTVTSVLLNDTNKWLETSAHPGQNVGAINNGATIGYWPADDFPQVMETITICVDPDAKNGTYTITVGDAGGGVAIYDGMGDYEQTPLTIGSYEVVVIPEPASMLLLAGLLPFLRRRRSA